MEALPAAMLLSPGESWAIDGAVEVTNGTDGSSALEEVDPSRLLRVNHQCEDDEFVGPSIGPYASLAPPSSSSTASTTSDAVPTPAFRSSALHGLAQLPYPEVSGINPMTSVPLPPLSPTPIAQYSTASPMSAHPHPLLSPGRHLLVLDVETLHVYLRVMMSAWWTEVQYVIRRVVTVLPYTAVHASYLLVSLYMAASRLTPLEAAACTVGCTLIANPYEVRNALLVMMVRSLPVYMHVTPDSPPSLVGLLAWIYPHRSRAVW